MNNSSKIVSLALEALQFNDVKPTYMDPSKKDLAQAPHEIESILPASTDPQSRFYEILTSKSYEICVKKLATYLQLPLDQLYARYPNVYSFAAIIMGALDEVAALELNHKEELEKLAIKIVLDLPEFSLFKSLYEKGMLKLDVQLGAGDLQGAVSLAEIEENQEELIEDIQQEIQADPERKLKRVFHNFVTQGNALHKSYLFNMANEQLQAISPALPVKYGLIMAVTHILYYGTPYMSTPQLKQASLGSEEVDGDSIKIRGNCFPVLVHEIVKGLFDYLGQDISPESHGSEFIEDEYMQLMAGPTLFQKLFAMIPNEKVEFFPIIYRLLMKRGVEDIKKVISNSPEGQRLVQGLAVDAERMHAAESKEEDDPYQPFNGLGGAGEDDGDDYGDDFGDGDEWKNN